MNQCFICLQTENNNATPISLLATQKQCICDGFVHSECITKWYNCSSICPICRQTIKFRQLSLVDCYHSLRKDVQNNVIIYITFIITVLVIIFLPIKN